MYTHLQRHEQRKECIYKANGKVVYDEFYPKYSKSIRDEIDKESDFIINYDIKYRIGKELEGEAEE